MVPPGEATTAASPATTTAGPAATDIVHGVDWFEGDAATAFDYFVLMEILKFFGDLILMAKFEFGSKASLWSTTAPSKYIPAPANGRTDMSRNRFVHVTLVLAGSGGGHWINHALPIYVPIDRKPEFGCEIQNAACGRWGVMMRLKFDDVGQCMRWSEQRKERPAEMNSEK
jgi:hypothetical protein